MTVAMAPDLLDGEVAQDLSTTALALARRFQHGATLWTAAPRWEPHAHHVAVEFVHPVVVGARALPACALTGPDPVTRARVATRPGDVLLVVAAASDPMAARLIRRAPAWGLTSVWIGHGPRPPHGAADHLLWLDDPDPLTPATGRFVLLYHLLWELVHVCFEHPAYLTEPAECTDDVCITCGDEGRLAEVIAPPAGRFSPAVVRTADGTQDADVTLVGEVSIGDLLLIHAGSALTVVQSAAEEL